MGINRCNAEGYSDPTAYEALRNTDNEKGSQKRALGLMKIKLINGRKFRCEKLEFFKKSVLIIGADGSYEWIDKHELSSILK